ncbi:MAG: zinc-ribbon domain-containing protein [Blastocatellia bacterium]|nr:zinc-ribbon domain-containing protein [Blastocatellia bacterium]
MFCPQCGHNLPDNSKFCMSCGAKIDATASSQPLAPVTPSSPVATEQHPLTKPSPGYMAYDNYQASSQRNWLENLVSKIPGYKGYLEKENRREVDKLHREHLAAMLYQLKTPINQLISELSSTGRLFEVGPLDRILKKLDKIENRIRYASYGYTGFFDIVKIKESQLDQIYQFDLALLNDVEMVKARVGQMISSSGMSTTLKTAAQELERELDSLDSKFSQRYQAIENPAWFPS